MKAAAGNLTHCGNALLRPPTRLLRAACGVTAHQKITELDGAASAPLAFAVKHVPMSEWFRQKVDGARYSENDSDKIMGRAEGLDVALICWSRSRPHDVPIGQFSFAQAPV